MLTIKDTGFAESILFEGKEEFRIIVYPNSGEAYHAERKTWMGISEPVSFVKMAEEWLRLGADMIGGCCRIGPEHIKKIKELEK